MSIVNPVEVQPSPPTAECVVLERKTVQAVEVAQVREFLDPTPPDAHYNTPEPLCAAVTSSSSSCGMTPVIFTRIATSSHTRSPLSPNG